MFITYNQRRQDYHSISKIKDCWIYCLFLWRRVVIIRCSVSEQSRLLILYKVLGKCEILVLTHCRPVNMNHLNIHPDKIFFFYWVVVNQRHAYCRKFIPDKPTFRSKCLSLIMKSHPLKWVFDHLNKFKASSGGYLLPVIGQSFFAWGCENFFLSLHILSKQHWKTNKKN